MLKRTRDVLLGVIRGWELCSVHIDMGIDIYDGREIEYMMSERGVWGSKHPDVTKDWRLGFKIGYNLRGEEHARQTR